MVNGNRNIRDLILFFAFACVPIASFLLQDEWKTNAQFFATLLVVNLVVLVWFKQYHPRDVGQLVDFDENLSLEKLMWIMAGGFAAYVAASIIISAFAISSIYVPFQGLTVSYAGFQLSGIWNDFLFNIVLVAPAEELCKLVLHLAFFMRLKGALSNGLARALSIGVPIGFWSILHVYSAYSGPNMLTLLGSAFVGGLIFFAVMYKTKSLFGAILSHALYNCIVIYVTYGGFP